MWKMVFLMIQFEESSSFCILLPAWLLVSAWERAERHPAWSLVTITLCSTPPSVVTLSRSGGSPPPPAPGPPAAAGSRRSLCVRYLDMATSVWSVLAAGGAPTPVTASPTSTAPTPTYTSTCTVQYSTVQYSTPPPGRARGGYRRGRGDRCPDQGLQQPPEHPSWWRRNLPAIYGLLFVSRHFLAQCTSCQHH